MLRSRVIGTGSGVVALAVSLQEVGFTAVAVGLLVEQRNQV
jgi:hypothetical protein